MTLGEILHKTSATAFKPFINWHLIVAVHTKISSYVLHPDSTKLVLQ